MSGRPKLLPAAAEDLAAAREWYENERPGLGRELVSETDKTLESIGIHPLMHAAGFHGVRQALVDRFPYVVYYRIGESEIEILAILHAKRNPRIWRART
jgi:plasmid stabilization system protein ParE